MPSADLLTSLADLFDELLDQHDTPAVAVGILPDGPSVELALHPLHGHPVDELIGFRAPDRWEAFGVAARGHTVAWPDDGVGARPLGPAPGALVRIVHLVDRGGAGTTRLIDGTGHRHDLAGETGGVVPDVCRRVLGLPTAPPSESPIRYWAARWLGDVIDLADLTLPGPEWATVAASHPAVAAVTDLDPELGPVAADHLVLAAEALAAAQPWDELHRRWSEPDAAGHGGLTPAEIAWMDPGMLARWCLGLVPELADLVGAVDALLPAAVVRDVHAALHAWGLHPAGRTADGPPTYDHEP